MIMIVGRLKNSSFCIFFCFFPFFFYFRSVVFFFFILAFLCFSISDYLLFFPVVIFFEAGDDWEPMFNQDYYTLKGMGH